MSWNQEWRVRLEDLMLLDRVRVWVYRRIDAEHVQILNSAGLAQTIDSPVDSFIPVDTEDVTFPELPMSALEPLRDALDTMLGYSRDKQTITELRDALKLERERVDRVIIQLLELRDALKLERERVDRVIIQLLRTT